MNDVHKLGTQTQPEKQEQIATVLHTPVDVRSVSLALLAVLGVIFTLHWAQDVFIPVMLGVMLS